MFVDACVECESFGLFGSKSVLNEVGRGEIQEVGLARFQEANAGFEDVNAGIATVNGRRVGTDQFFDIFNAVGDFLGLASLLGGKSDTALVNKLVGEDVAKLFLGGDDSDFASSARGGGKNGFGSEKSRGIHHYFTASCFVV